MLFSKSDDCNKSDQRDGYSCNDNDSSGENFSNKNNKIIYKVVNGDSLYSISEKYNVSVTDIMNWNDLNNNKKIFRGQKLVIKTARRNEKLSPGESIRLYRPEGKWKVIKGYTPYGDIKNFGLLYTIGSQRSIKPANSGTVVKISYLRGYGKYILIDHGNGWHSMYSNLDDVKVKSGQYVNFSETIGNIKDNKLFFLLAYNGKPVNPTGYFKTTVRD
ncbi:MAG: LysM peptidoglycan-binding domain-containing M23 family metallopeptidase [Spirochaetia bacterium]|nr:LysM peptidoglycan-binding domain-containing M23 family metallopeptidase [Spirochaetia bacterium]